MSHTTLPKLSFGFKMHRVAEIRLSQNADTVLVGMSDGSLSLWNVNSSIIKWSIPLETYSPYGKRICAQSTLGIGFAAMWSGQISAFSMADGSQLWTKRYEKELHEIHSAQAGATLYCLYDSGLLLELDQRTGDIVNKHRSVDYFRSQSIGLVRFTKNKGFALPSPSGADIIFPIQYRAIHWAVVVDNHLFVSEFAGDVDVYDIRSQEHIRTVSFGDGSSTDCVRAHSQSGALHCLVATELPRNHASGHKWLIQVVRIDSTGSSEILLELPTRGQFSWDGSKFVSMYGDVYQLDPLKLIAHLPWAYPRKP